jgi:hypothetical protein
MMERCEFDASCSAYGSAAGSCGHGNESSGSIRGGEILE